MDAKVIGEQFVKHYYKTFDEDRAKLVSLYINESRLLFEGQEFQGPEAIVKKLTSLPFKVVQHVITTVDSQPTIDNRLFICVLGQLKTDDDPPHSFFQTFLLGEANGTLMVLNDVFRLVIHHG